MSLRLIARTRSEVNKRLGEPIGSLFDVTAAIRFNSKLEKACEDVLAAHRKLRFECIACGASSQEYEHYMVTDELWNTTVGYEDVCVCQACLESAMGRDLTEKDLMLGPDGKHLPCNYVFVERMALQTAGTAIMSPTERAKKCKESEDFYANILKKNLTPKQITELENSNPPGVAHRITNDPVKAHRKSKRVSKKKENKDD